MTPYGVQMGTTCAVHRHREMVPMERHHVWPLGHHGPNRPENMVTVCENGHGSIHSYLDLLIKQEAGTPIPWTVRRRYGRKVRALAQLGYERILKGSM